MYIADTWDRRIRKVSNGIITTVAGNGGLGFSGDGGPATSAELGHVTSVAFDGAGDFFLADGPRVREVDSNGTIITVAGGGSPPSGDGGPATSALLNLPAGVSVDAAGNIFICDTADNRIRKVAPDGVITTIAGIGTAGFSGDGGPGTLPCLRARPQQYWIPREICT